MDQKLPEVPSNDPTQFCRLCFSENRIHWVIRTSGTEVDKPFIKTIGECLGIWLTLEKDFPCAVCRACSSWLERILQFREKCRQCDEALKKKRDEEPLAMVMFYDYPEGRVFLNGATKPSSVGNDPDFELEPVEQKNTQRTVRKKIDSSQIKQIRKSKATKAAELKKYFESYRIWKATVSARRDDDEMTIVAPETLEQVSRTGRNSKRKGVRNKCCLCKRKFKTAISLKKHFQAKHRNLQCPKCGRAFATYTILKQHMMRHQTSGLINCEKCGIQFVTAVEYESHRKNKDCDMDMALMCQCEYCGRKFSRRGRYLYHLKRLHPDKPLPPDLYVAPQASAEKSEFYDTRKFQTDSNNPPRMEKGRFVVMLEPLPSEAVDDNNIVVSSRETSRSRSPSPVVELSDTFVCTLCFVQFDELAEFNHHLEDCYGIENDPESLSHPPPPYVLCGCAACSVIFQRSGQLEEHLLQHERPYEVKLHDCLCCHRSNSEPPERPDSPAAILGD